VLNSSPFICPASQRAKGEESQAVTQPTETKIEMTKTWRLRE